MHKTHIFDQNNNAKIIFLPTYVPYFFSDRYRKQTIFFLSLTREFIVLFIMLFVILSFINCPTRESFCIDFCRIFQSACNFLHLEAVNRPCLFHSLINHNFTGILRNDNFKQIIEIFCLLKIDISRNYSTKYFGLIFKGLGVQLIPRHPNDV